MAFRRQGMEDVPTTFTTLYTVPTGYEAIVHPLTFTNISVSGTVKVSAQVIMNVTPTPITIMLANDVTLSANASLSLDKFVLYEGDVLEIKSDTVSHADAYASIVLTNKDALAP